MDPQGVIQIDTTDIVQLICVVLLLILSAFFSSAETALSTVNKVRIKSLAEEGNKRAKKVLKILDNYGKMLSTILVGNNIVNIASSSLATVLMMKAFPQHGALISTIAMTIIVLIFGEVTFTNGAGFDPITPREFDLEMGSWLQLPNR